MSQDSPDRATQPYPRLILVVSAVIGLAMAGTALVRTPDSSPVSADAAAVVNGVPIDRAEYNRALEAVSKDARNPISEDDAAAILNRLIEQELLVQRALELGFDQRDRTVRNTLITAMVQTIIAEAESADIDDADLRAFYEENAAYFAPAAKVRLREMRVPVNAETPDAQARERAETAAARLRLGEPFDVVATELGTPPIAPVPDGLLPIGQLRTYLGPTPAQVAAQLSEGTVSDPIRGGSAYHVLQVLEREASATPPIEDIHDLVESEMRRRAGDAALREYLDRLVAEADIQRTL